MSDKFKKLLIDALEDAVEKHKHHHAILKDIDSELAARRMRTRNTALRHRIKILLASAVNHDPPQRTPEVRKPNLARLASNKTVPSLNTQSNKSSNTMTRDTTIKYPDKFLISAFEGMRQKLLDISGGRSRLLNLDQNSKSFVRLVDELPNELIKVLLAEKSMLIRAVPEPTLSELIEQGYLEWDEEKKQHVTLKQLPEAKEWADLLGINTHFELPNDASGTQDERQTDTNLQSVQFEAQLNLALKKLASEAKTAIDETGNNVLFLCLGFIEWVDQADSKIKRLAPLYLLPISINKEFRNGIAVHTIKYNGEDIIQNLILREKMQQDFGLTLPDLVDPSNEEKLLTPEEYFKEVSALLERKQNDVIVRSWKVRRFATLATLSLGKLLMYRDLDPRNWPADKGNLLEHDVIKRFFHDGAQSSNTGFYNESYVLDDIKNLHEDFPMIEDADSSQMSVLIDVLKGKNLVVEGPPGTGKSQTITNIISAALSQGKTILFVAEKQAALEVVKRRMDKVGLGDFCLDLHSDKAQKRLVLDDFKQRIFNNQSFNYSEGEYNRALERYERAREKLQNYVLLINRKWKDSGLSIHEIFMAASRFEAAVAPLKFKQIAPENFSSESFSKAILDEKIEQLELFYNYLNGVSKQLPEAGNWASHPWFGVENKGLSGQDSDEITEELKAWTSRLSIWCQSVIQHCQLQGIRLNKKESLFAAENLIDTWKAIPSPRGQVNFSALGKMTPDDIKHLEAYVLDQAALTDAYQSITTTFTKELIENLALIEVVDVAMQTLSAFGVDKNIRLNDITRALSTLNCTITRLESIKTVRAELVPHMPDNAQPILSCDLAGLKELETFILLSAELPVQFISCRDALFDNEALANFITTFISQYQALIDEKESLEKMIVTNKLPSVDVLQEYAATLEKTGFFSWFDSSWRKTKKWVKAFSKSAKFNPKQMAQTLSEAADWSAKSADFSKDPKNIRMLGDHFKGLNTDVTLVMDMITWFQRVRREYGIGFGKRVSLAQALFSVPDDVFRGIQNLSQQDLVKELETLRLECKTLSELFTAIPCLSDKEVDFSNALNPLTEARDAIISVLTNAQHYLLNTNMSQTNLRAKIKESKKLIQLSASIENNKTYAEIFSDKLDLVPLHSVSVSEAFQVVVDTLEYSKRFHEQCKNESIIALLKRQTDADAIRALQNVGEELAKQLIEVKDDERAFFESVGAHRETWFQFSGHSIEKVIERNESAISNGAWLDGWIKYLYAKERMELGGFTLLNRYLSQNSHSLTFAKNAMKFATYHSLAREIYQEQPELSQLSGHEQTALQQQFAKYDDTLKKLQRKRVAARAADRVVPAGQGGARAASYTNDALLTREIEKKTRHISIRNLVTRAGDAMVAYKPCFMMSPMAVAKYIPPGRLNFDIVVMDEASQVKPQDALSCFARGKQIVVVGDSKQLPPTSFFERSITNDIEDNEEDTGVIDEAESILDAVGAYFDKRQLRWHYRSRHESLIEFSNHKFYDGNLVVFPSPWNQSDEYGIKFNHVKEGRFINSVNQTESHIVVGAIREHLIHNANESLGIVAMNAKQREMIESTLETAIANDALLMSAYMNNQNSEDPLFIKNLENVQGDERDVIFISFTYGPKEKGAANMPQRFGPINGASGWRRLNVLFTRAKKRIQVYSSMTADQIVLTETSSRGLQSLKAYLQFAQTGRLIGQDGMQQGEPDSDFEIAVMDALAKSGFECVPQVGVAGFFIDIAVRDPGMPGRYLMGIECDGATYHSSKSTRDRDRVRQGVLENLGWKIRRIWSTDWFKNAEAELKPIIDELRLLSSPILQEKIIEIDAFENANADMNVSGRTEECETAATTLKDALRRFNEDVIVAKYPNTEPHRRLLRPDMLEHLVLDRPLTYEEFVLIVPGYLRTNTHPQEAKEYLEDVLEIITDYESMESVIK